MTKVYVIVRSNGYDGFDLPEDECYLSKDIAEKECEKINKLHYGADKKYWSFDVSELYFKE